MAAAKHLRVSIEGRREVSALLLTPAKPKYLLVLGDGAGAGMNHPFMEKLADELAAVNVATFRYQFPYMEEQRRVPDTPAVLTATVAAAVRTAHEAGPKLFLQGTRDTLADLKLLRPVLAKLGSRATLHIIETADHSFHVLKSSKKTDAEVMRELAETTAAWAQKI